MLFNNLYHRRDCKEQEALKAAILKEIPEAQVEFLVGEGGELDDWKYDPIMKRKS